MEAHSNPELIAVGLFDQVATIVRPSVADPQIEETDLVAIETAGALDVVSRTSSLIRFRVSQLGFDLIAQQQINHGGEPEPPAVTLAPVPLDDARLEKVEWLKTTLVNRATGGRGDEEAYKRLRLELLSDAEIAPLLPPFVRQNRDLTDFWTFIKFESPTYDGRRAYLRKAFERVLSHLEERRGLITSSPEGHGPTASIPATGLGRDTAPIVERAAVSAAAKQPSSSNRVFLVHGRTKGPRDAVARLIRDVGLDAVILEEQPNQGRTIIEKFEANTDVACAVVVLTPEDEARTKGATTPFADRARQNVILELGFFIGLLGRRHVIAVAVGHVERPSDIDGVLYIQFDEGGGWRLLLAKELKAAGLSVDLTGI